MLDTKMIGTKIKKLRRIAAGNASCTMDMVQAEKRIDEVQERIKYLRGRLAHYAIVEDWGQCQMTCNECGGDVHRHYPGCVIADVESIESRHFKFSFGVGYERVTPIDSEP